jgi:DNA-binding transcriptional LysR family regulator
MQWEERIGRRLKLRDLHILLAVVQWGSMAKAATELAISQPAVSKAMADMEHALGLKLLDRGPRGIEATVYGRALLRRALAVFDELKQGVKELEFLADPTSGELRIGSSEGMAAGFLPAVINQLSGRYPGLVLNVSQAVFAAMQYRDLRERGIDVLLGRIFVPFAEDDLDAEILFDDQVVVVAGRESPWARRRRPAGEHVTAVIARNRVVAPIACDRDRCRTGQRNSLDAGAECKRDTGVRQVAAESQIFDPDRRVFGVVAGKKSKLLPGTTNPEVRAAVIVAKSPPPPMVNVAMLRLHFMTPVRRHAGRRHAQALRHHGKKGGV